MINKTVFLLVLSVVIISCGNNDKNANTADSLNDPDSVVAKTEKDSTSALSGAVISIATSSDKGAELIIQNDCRNCHKERERLIGPAFTSIANKYMNKDIDVLASKIIKGGSGNWGDVPMSPHPSLPMQDANTIVAFILQMKR
jgi:cytochrome c